MPSYASTVNKWKLTAGGFEKHKDDLAFAQEDADKLTAFITQAEKINLEQEQLKADLSKKTELLNACLDDGNKAKASIIRFAKGKYGPSSKELKDFQSKGDK